MATNGSDLSVLLWFVQFLKMSFRFYSHTVIDHIFFLEFLCYYLFIELDEFSTVLQTLNCVTGLHNCLEFSKLPLCLDEAMYTGKKSSIAKLCNNRYAS